MSVLAWWMGSTSCTACMPGSTDPWMLTPVDPGSLMSGRMSNMLKTREEATSLTLNKYQCTTTV